MEDIHALIQAHDAMDIYTLISTHCEQVDDHVLVCEEWHAKVIGRTADLPKLRARMTVHSPPIARNGRPDVSQLKVGQCLPCGCEVTNLPWTREYAYEAFYKVLAEIIQVPEATLKSMSEATRLTDLPLSTKSLRRLRDHFWIPDSSSSSEEARDAEEGDEVRQLPETVGDFVTELVELESGVGISACDDHWL